MSHLQISEKLVFLHEGQGVDVNPVDLPHIRGNFCPGVPSLNPLICPKFNQAQVRSDFEPRELEHLLQTAALFSWEKGFKFLDG